MPASPAAHRDYTQKTTATTKPRENGGMSPRVRRILITVGLFALAVLVGSILGNAWLGVALGVLIGIGALIAMSSKAGGNQGIYDRDDDGTEL